MIVRSAGGSSRLLRFAPTAGAARTRRAALTNLPCALLAGNSRSRLPTCLRPHFRRDQKRNREIATGKRRSHLETWLDKDLHEWFENRQLVIDEAIANRWGLLAAAAQRAGMPLAIIDGLLSATALEHKLTVVTRNSTDFMNAGVAILNPWHI